MAISTGKIVEVLFENAMDEYEHQDMLLDRVTINKPDERMLQNADNVIWRPVQQHAPILTGFDLTGQETTIIEETYPSILGTPTNDLVSVRADQMRDMGFWERRGKQSGKRQGTELNKVIASAIALQGGIFYRSNATSGYNFVAEAQATLNERQTPAGETRTFVLNDRDTLTYAADLAGRQTLQGRPADTWKTGQIGQNVAEFDVFTGSFLPNLAGGADPATTVTGNQSFAPTGGSVNTSTGIVTNVDYRSANIPVAASAGYSIGDKVVFKNAGTAVTAVGLADKTDTGQPMTFTVVAKPDGTTITVYPKPIADNDPGLTSLEKAYSNINTRILNAATVNRQNTDATNKTNIFWDKGAVEVISGTIPANLFSQFNGMQVINSTMKNGQEMYMIYRGNVEALTFTFRIFTWYGVTIANPMACGCAVTY